MKEKYYISKDIKEQIILCIIPLVLVLIMELFFKICTGTGLFCYNSTILSILIGYAVFAVILSIVKKISKTSIIVSIFIFVLLLINQLKIFYVGEPIYFSDINFFYNFKDLFSIVFSAEIYPNLLYLFPFFILAILFIILIKFIKKYDLEITNLKMRVTFFVIGILFLLMIFVPSNFTKNIWLNLFFEANAIKDYNHYTTNYSYYEKYGLLSGMYGVMLNNRFSEPENYDEQKLNNILKENAENTTNKSFGKPNIIVVFSESFFDISKIKEVTFNKEVTGNFNKLKEEGKYVNLLSCTYGGLSENVAFELLTGGKVQYFSKGYIPIMSLYKRKNSDQLPSLIKELNKNGYISKIVFGKDYYNSEKALRKIGFDDYLEVKQTNSNTKGYYVSDEYLTDLIIDNFENKESNQPIFYMTETIQNHMSYDFDKYEKYDISIQTSNLADNMNSAILSYAQGVYDTDQQLQKLYNYIKSYDEPTILIFLGDHLPYLYTESGENAINNLEYFNSENDLKATYKKYNTDGLILSNYEIEYDKIPEYLSNDMLLTCISNQMDIEISDYYKWLFTTMESLPASNLYVSLDKNGEKYFTSELEDEMKKTNNLRQLMQYKLFIEPTK